MLLYLQSSKARQQDELEEGKQDKVKLLSSSYSYSLWNNSLSLIKLYSSLSLIKLYSLRFLNCNLFPLSEHILSLLSLTL